MLVLRSRDMSNWNINFGVCELLEVYYADWTMVWLKTGYYQTTYPNVHK